MCVCQTDSWKEDFSIVFLALWNLFPLRLGWFVPCYLGNFEQSWRLLATLAEDYNGYSIVCWVIAVLFHGFILRFMNQDTQSTHIWDTGKKKGNYSIWVQSLHVQCCMASKSVQPEPDAFMACQTVAGNHLCGIEEMVPLETYSSAWSSKYLSKCQLCMCMFTAAQISTRKNNI